MYRFGPANNVMQTCGTAFFGIRCLNFDQPIRFKNFETPLMRNIAPKKGKLRELAFLHNTPLGKHASQELQEKLRELEQASREASLEDLRHLESTRPDSPHPALPYDILEESLKKPLSEELVPEEPILKKAMPRKFNRKRRTSEVPVPEPTGVKNPPEEDLPDDFSEFSSDGTDTKAGDTEAQTPSDISVAAENIDVVSILETSQTHTISEKYDLILLVAHESTLNEVRVSKSILAHSSDQIDEMLCARPTRWCTRDSRRMQYIELKGDLTAVLTTLNILHFRAGDNLYNLDFDMVRRIAVVCESYSWYQSIYPWPRIWLKKYKDDAKTPGYEDWLYISQVFRAAADEKRELLKLLSIVCKPSPGHYIDRSGKRISTQIWPAADLEEILHARWSKIRRIIDTLRTVYKPFRDTDEKAIKELCGDPVCLYVARGSLLSSLTENDLFKFVEVENAKSWAQIWGKTAYRLSPDAWNGSVLDLLELVRKVSLITLKERVPGHECKMEGVLKDIHEFKI
ncbi:hypothetical protein TWF694_008022 [Orbilia ellipsospora]|uniref:BTB domain-containing protein n=1 Tax=Orbilia ellipsospora TaxID=2528407 RepID=A0AAV9XFE8_9PEZI